MKHNKRMKRLHSSEQLHEKVQSCVCCHDHLHAILTEKELSETYNTVEKILDHPEMQKFISWIANKPSDFIVHSKHANARA